MWFEIMKDNFKEIIYQVKSGCLYLSRKALPNINRCHYKINLKLYAITKKRLDELDVIFKKIEDYRESLQNLSLV
jgi:hypothetical protein